MAGGPTIRRPSTCIPSPPGTLPAYALNATSEFIYPAGLDLTNTGTWGPAPFGPAAAYKLHYYRQLLPNYEVTLPTSICPTCTPTAVAAANTWSPRDLASLVERLGGAIVATHSQSGIQGHDMVRVLKEDGKLSLLKGLITVEGSCSSDGRRARRQRTSITSLTWPSRATTRSFSQACQDTVDAINARRALRVMEPPRRTTSSWMTRRITGSSTASRT